MSETDNEMEQTQEQNEDNRSWGKQRRARQADDFKDEKVIYDRDNYKDKDRTQDYYRKMTDYFCDVNARRLFNRYIETISTYQQYKDLIKECYKDRNINDILPKETFYLFMYVKYLQVIIDELKKMKKINSFAEQKCLAQKLKIDEDSIYIIDHLPESVMQLFMDNILSKYSGYKDNQNIIDVFNYVDKTVKIYVSECTQRKHRFRFDDDNGEYEEDPGDSNRISHPEDDEIETNREESDEESGEESE